MYRRVATRFRGLRLADNMDGSGGTDGLRKGKHLRALFTGEVWGAGRDRTAACPGQEAVWPFPFVVENAATMPI